MILASPLDIYIAKVFKNEKVSLSKVLEPIERWIYKILKVDEKEEMTGKEYTMSVIVFSILSLIFLLALQML